RTLGPFSRAPFYRAHHRCAGRDRGTCNAGPRSRLEKQEMIAVQVDSLSKRYGAFAALSDVSLTVEAGERRAIIGPNGAGKTTLFSIIAGQKEPTSGQIRINGEDTTGARPEQMWARGLTR